MSKTKSIPASKIPKPVYGRVVILRDEQDDKTAGGIVIPDLYKEKLTTGTVLAVHPGLMLESGANRVCQVKPGERVVYGKYSGSDVEVDGYTFLIVPEYEILSIVAHGDCKVVIDRERTPAKA
jgi:chaperonin GroES